MYTDWSILTVPLVVIVTAKIIHKEKLIGENFLPGKNLQYIIAKSKYNLYTLDYCHNAQKWNPDQKS